MVEFKYNNDKDVYAYGAEFPKGKTAILEDEFLIEKARANPEFSEIVEKKKTSKVAACEAAASKVVVSK